MLSAQAQSASWRAIEGRRIEQGIAAPPTVVMACLLCSLSLLLPRNTPVVIPLLNLILADLAALPEQVERGFMELHSSVLLRRLRREEHLASSTCTLLTILKSG